MAKSSTLSRNDFHSAQILKAVDTLAEGFLEIANQYFEAYENTELKIIDKDQPYAVFAQKPNKKQPLSNFFEQPTKFIIQHNAIGINNSGTVVKLNEKELLNRAVQKVDEDGDSEVSICYDKNNKPVTAQALASLLLQEDLLENNEAYLNQLHDSLSTFISKYALSELTNTEKMTVITLLVKLLKKVCRDAAVQDSLTAFCAKEVNHFVNFDADDDTVTIKNIIKMLLNNNDAAFSLAPDFDVNNQKHVEEYFNNGEARAKAGTQLMHYLTQSPALLRMAHEDNVSKYIEKIFTVTGALKVSPFNRQNVKLSNIPVINFNEKEKEQLTKALFRANIIEQNIPDTNVKNIFTCIWGEVSKENLHALTNVILSCGQDDPFTFVMGLLAEKNDEELTNLFYQSYLEAMTDKVFQDAGSSATTAINKIETLINTQFANNHSLAESHSVAIIQLYRLKQQAIEEQKSDINIATEAKKARLTEEKEKAAADEQKRLALNTVSEKVTQHVVLAINNFATTAENIITLFKSIGSSHQEVNVQAAQDEYRRFILATIYNDTNGDTVKNTFLDQFMDNNGTLDIPLLVQLVSVAHLSNEDSQNFVERLKNTLNAEQFQQKDINSLFLQLSLYATDEMSEKFIQNVLDVEHQDIEGTKTVKIEALQSSVLSLVNFIANDAYPVIDEAHIDNVVTVLFGSQSKDYKVTDFINKEKANNNSLTDEDIKSLEKLTALLSTISGKQKVLQDTISTLDGTQDQLKNTLANSKLCLGKLYKGIYELHEESVKALFTAKATTDSDKGEEALQGFLTEISSNFTNNKEQEQQFNNKSEEPIHIKLRKLVKSNINYTDNELEAAKNDPVQLYTLAITSTPKAKDAIKLLTDASGKKLTESALQLFANTQRLISKMKGEDDLSKAPNFLKSIKDEENDERLYYDDIAKRFTEEQRSNLMYLNDRLVTMYHSFTAEQRGTIIRNLSKQMDEAYKNKLTAYIMPAVVANFHAAKTDHQENCAKAEQEATTIAYGLDFFFAQLSTIAEYKLVLNGEQVNKPGEALSLLFNMFPNEVTRIFSIAMDKEKWAENTVTKHHIIQAFAAFTHRDYFFDQVDTLLKIINRFDKAIDGKTALTLLALTDDLLLDTQAIAEADNSSRNRKSAAAAETIRTSLMGKALNDEDLLSNIARITLEQHIEKTLMSLKNQQAKLPKRLSDIFLDQSNIDILVAKFRQRMLFNYFQNKTKEFITASNSHFYTEDKINLLVSKDFDSASKAYQNKLIKAFLGENNETSSFAAEKLNGFFAKGNALSNKVANTIIRKHHQIIFQANNFNNIADAKTKATLFLAGYNNRNAIESGLITDTAIVETTKQNKRFRTMLEETARANPEVIADILRTNPTDDENHLFSLRQLRDFASSDLPRLLIKEANNVSITKDILQEAMNYGYGHTGKVKDNYDISGIKLDEYDASHLNTSQEVIAAIGSDLDTGQNGFAPQIDDEIKNKIVTRLSQQVKHKANCERTQLVRELFINYNLDVQVAKSLIDGLEKDGNLLVSDIISIFVERNMRKQPLDTAIANHLMYHVMSSSRAEERFLQFSDFADHLDNAAIAHYKEQLLAAYIEEYKATDAGKAIEEADLTPLQKKEAFLELLYHNEIAAKPTRKSTLEAEIADNKTNFVKDKIKNYTNQQDRYKRATDRVLNAEKNIRQKAGFIEYQMEQNNPFRHTAVIERMKNTIPVGLSEDDYKQFDINDLQLGLGQKEPALTTEQIKSLENVYKSYYNELFTAERTELEQAVNADRKDSYAGFESFCNDKNNLIPSGENNASITIAAYEARLKDKTWIQKYQQDNDDAIASNVAQHNDGVSFHYADVEREPNTMEAIFRQQELVDVFLNYDILDKFAKAKEQIFLAARQADEKNIKVRLGIDSNHVQEIDISTEERNYLEHGLILNAKNENDYSANNAAAMARELEERSFAIANGFASNVNDSKYRLQHTFSGHYLLSGNNFAERKASLIKAYQIMRAKDECGNNGYKTLNMQFKATSSDNKEYSFDTAKRTALALERGKKELEHRTMKWYYIHRWPSRIILAIKKLFNSVPSALSGIKLKGGDSDSTIKVKAQAWGARHTSKSFVEQRNNKEAPLSVQYAQTTTDGSGNVIVEQTPYEPRFFSQNKHSKFHKAHEAAFSTTAEKTSEELVSDAYRAAQDKENVALKPIAVK